MRRFLWILILVVSLAAGCSSTKEDKLAKDLHSKDAETRRKAAIELGEVATTEALRLLELQAEDSDFRVRDEVRKALAKIKARTFMK